MFRQKRVGAVLVCAVLLLAVFFSSVLMAHEAEHDCTGEDCPVCQAIAMSGSFLRLVAAAILSFVFLLGLLNAKRPGFASRIFDILVLGTLVSWKIRLND